MSLTQANTLFAAVHEDGLNDFVSAFFNARPRHLIFGSPLFVPSTTVSATSISAISFPGIPGGIQYAVAFEQPRLDLHPDTFGFGLPPGPNQFSIEIKFILAVACNRKGDREIDPKIGAVTFNPSNFEPISAELGLCARGEIIRQGAFLKLSVDQVEIKDIKPDSLESVLECLIRMMFQAAIAQLRIPYRSIFVQIGTINPGPGPIIQDDQVQAWADFV